MVGSRRYNTFKEVKFSSLRCSSHQEDRFSNLQYNNHQCSNLHCNNCQFSSRQVVWYNRNQVLLLHSQFSIHLDSLNSIQFSSQPCQSLSGLRNSRYKGDLILHIKHPNRLIELLYRSRGSLEILIQLILIVDCKDLHLRWFKSTIHRDIMLFLMPTLMNMYLIQGIRMLVLIIIMLDSPKLKVNSSKLKANSFRLKFRASQHSQLQA